MAKSAQELRNGVLKVLEGKSLHDHQREAAKKTFEAFDKDTRAVVTAAEMQAGKSGVALALCCQQRLSLSDLDITSRKKLRDTLYLITMPDVALLEQAKDDLNGAKNVIVSNFVRFENDLENEFKENPPKLIIIDECHYGSNVSAVRYHKIFDYLEENDTCKVVFISATPFGALYAAETAYDKAKEIQEEAVDEQDDVAATQAASIAQSAVANSLLRRSFGTKLVFHRTSDEYYGVREMIAAGKVKGLESTNKNFLIPSNERNEFIDYFHNYPDSGWSLVRVPASTAMEAKEFFLAEGVPEENIFILGLSLSGVPEDEQTNIDKFKKEFHDAIDFGEKLVAITVAGCRAGINFGPLMKNNLISTWDSTVASVAAVVQANIGRACGYHENNESLHFTNMAAAEAYSASLDYLEKNTNEHSSSDFEGLREFFDDLCEEYNVQGLDVGITVKRKKRKPIGDVETYFTNKYIAVPGKLLHEEYDYKQHTDDDVLLQAISMLRDELLRNYGPKVKGHRAMRGKYKNWIKAQWVNGDTYDNKEKARKVGTMKERTLLFTKKIDKGEKQEYNQVVMPGSGELSENKLVTATVFSVYNQSRRDVKKKIMSEQDMHEICEHFGVEKDDTLFVLYKRGEYSIELSTAKKHANLGPDVKTNINDESQFTGLPDVIF